MIMDQLRSNIEKHLHNICFYPSRHVYSTLLGLLNPNLGRRL